MEKQLNIIKINLAEFKVSRLLLKGSDYRFLDSLKIIDEILNRYQNFEENLAIVNSNSPAINKIPTSSKNSSQNAYDSSYEPVIEIKSMTADDSKIFSRSLGRTIKKIKRDMNPRSEEQYLQNLRYSSRNTRQGIRCLILLILVPLLVQKVSKQFLVLPVVEHFRSFEKTPIFLHQEMKEEAMRELQAFEEELKFNNLLHRAPKISAEEMEEKIMNKANELAEEFYHKGNGAISNVLSDLLGVLAFAGVVITNPKGVRALKLFLGEIIGGLSDSAQAFILILFTDMFVGFHSPHGWEVILEGLSEHLGLPANRGAIFLFIATFPVILDTIFKYWIFRYMNQISPSAVATLKNMNE